MTSSNVKGRLRLREACALSSLLHGQGRDLEIQISMRNASAQ